MQVITQNITEKMIAEALELDKAYYPQQYLLTMGQCLDYFHKNDQIYTMLVDDGHVIGYLNFSPITDDKYDEIQAGDCIDTSIEGKDIVEYLPGKEYSGYFSSIVIDRAYRGKGYGNLLVRLLSETIADLYSQGVVFKRIIADVLNDAGAAVVRNFGLTYYKKTKNHSTLYVGVFDPMMIKRTKYNDAMMAKYEKQEKTDD